MVGYRECPNCIYSSRDHLRLHKYGKRLRCRMCGYTIMRGNALIKYGKAPKVMINA